MTLVRVRVATGHEVLSTTLGTQPAGTEFDVEPGEKLDRWLADGVVTRVVDDAGGGLR